MIIITIIIIFFSKNIPLFYFYSFKFACLLECCMSQPKLFPLLLCAWIQKSDNSQTQEIDFLHLVYISAQSYIPSLSLRVVLNIQLSHIHRFYIIIIKIYSEQHCATTAVLGPVRFSSNNSYLFLLRTSLSIVY